MGCQRRVRNPEVTIVKGDYANYTVLPQSGTSIGTFPLHRNYILHDQGFISVSKCELDYYKMLYDNMYLSLKELVNGER